MHGHGDALGLYGHGEERRSGASSVAWAVAMRGRLTHRVGMVVEVAPFRRRRLRPAVVLIVVVGVVVVLGVEALAQKPVYVGQDSGDERADVRNSIPT